MKTILIVIAGMADMPDPFTLKDTPLVASSTPSLDMLARRGELLSVPVLNGNFEVSHKNALLTLLGYDLQRGEPSAEELMEFGLNKSASITQYPGINPYIIPGFSGHGVCVTTSAWVRGIGKCALLDSIDIYSPGSSDSEILETISKLTTESIVTNEFVLVYVDSPLKASLRGDFEGKVASLNNIDRHLITPIADFVWKSDLLINMAITTDLATPWFRRIPAQISVPAILYFNNHDQEGDPEQKFTEVEAMLRPWKMSSPSDLIRYLCSFEIADET